MSHKKFSKNISLLSIEHICMDFRIWFSNWDDHNVGKNKSHVLWVDYFYDLL